MRDSIRAVIGRNEGPAAIADTSVFNRPNQIRVKEHLPWNRVAVDTAVTEGAATPHPPPPTPQPPPFVIAAVSEPRNRAITP